MAPYGSVASTDPTNDFWGTLPPLGDSKFKVDSASSFFLDPVDGDEPRTTFVLALVDERGEPLRAASEQDLAELLEVDKEPPKPKEESEEPKSAQQFSDAVFRQLLLDGPVCKHCGVTESPQWRRGPPAKPILCNACGTRYRRTGQLNHAAQNAANRKRATQSDCAREMVGEKARAMKQPRVVA